MRLQKNVLRTISHSNYYANDDHVFKKLNIMQIKKIHDYKVALTMFKVKHLSAPSVLWDLFIENKKSVHDYNTRQREHFHVPLASRNYLQRSICYKGVDIWNRVCKYIPYDCSFFTFKYSLHNDVLADDSILRY